MKKLLFCALFAMMGCAGMGPGDDESAQTSDEVEATGEGAATSVQCSADTCLHSCICQRKYCVEHHEPDCTAEFNSCRQFCLDFPL